VAGLLPIDEPVMTDREFRWFADLVRAHLRDLVRA
jgi:hypothetical protein